MKKWFGPWSAARVREDRLSAGTLGFKGPNPEPSAFALLCMYRQPTRRESMPRPRRARSIGVELLCRIRVHWFSQSRSGKDYAVPAAMIR